MDTEQSLKIIQELSQGVDPHTGEPIAEESPTQHPLTRQALLEAVQALERTRKSEDRIRQRQLPSNAGKTWGKEEDQRLVVAFDTGKTTNSTLSDSIATRC